MGTKPALRARIIVSFMLATALLASAALIIYRSAHHVQEILVTARHARSMFNALHTLLATVDEAETGQRGYLMTADPAYLEPYRRATSRVETDLTNLQKLVEQNPEQRARVMDLRTRVASKLTELQHTVELERSGNAEEARKIVLEGTGEREMAVIRATISSMIQEQNNLADGLRSEFRNGVINTNRFLIVGICVQFGLLILVFVFMYRDASYRARTAGEIEGANARLTAILSTMGDGLYQVDTEGRLVYLNPAGERMLGYNWTDIAGMRMHNLIQSRTPAGDPRQAKSSPLTKVAQTGLSYSTHEEWFQCKNGSFITVELSGTALRREGEIIGVVVSFRDVTQRRQREEELRATTELQQAILRSASVAVLTTRADGVITTFNLAAERMLQYKADEVVGKLTLIDIHDSQEIERRARELSTELGVSIAANSGVFTVKAGRFGLRDQAEWTYLRKDGSRFPVSLSITALRDSEGKVNGYLALAEDITERKKAEAAIQESQTMLKAALEQEKDQARLDFLTQIPNRRAFYEVAAVEATRSRRYRRPLTLVYLDLDNFKQVNDSLGHDAGDELLIEVAATLRSNVRTTDVVARLGGDEFALLLPETNEEGAAGVTNKVRERLLEAMRQRNWPVTFSIGLMTFPVPPESVEEMIKQADAMMYSAKLKGKNSIAVRSGN